MPRGTKVKPKYKQMAFETAIRNPERYKNIIKIVSKYEGRKLDDVCLLNIVCELYLKREVSSNRITISDNSTIESIRESVIKVNSTRRADGGFPRGYPSRFWTYMRTPSELNFVYARYNEILKISPIAKMMIEDKISETDAFSIQAMKYNRKSPYRNVSNDFNYFSFICKVLLKMHTLNKKLSYYQFILSLFSPDSNIDNFINLIKIHKFSNNNDVYTFLRKKYGCSNTKQTVLRDYPDVVLRLLRITGFITISYSGIFFIEINKDRIDYIKELLTVPTSYTSQEKEDALSYYNKANSLNVTFLNIVEKYAIHKNTDKETLNDKLSKIITSYKISQNDIIASLINLNSNKIPAFKYIPDPLKLEFYLSILLYFYYKDKFDIKPNYIADSVGMPISHAPGNMGDIELINRKIYWLIEATLIRNKTQQFNNETTSVVNHLSHSVPREQKFLSFVAPYIHENTDYFFKYAIFASQSSTTYIKPYNLRDFISTTINKQNLQDMITYKKDVEAEFRKRLLNQ